MRKFAAVTLLTLTIATTASAAVSRDTTSARGSRARENNGTIARVTRIVKKLFGIEANVDRPVKPVPIIEETAPEPGL